MFERDRWKIRLNVEKGHFLMALRGGIFPDCFGHFRIHYFTPFLTKSSSLNL